MHRRSAFITLGLVFAFAAGCVYYTTQLNLDYNFQAFFPLGDPDLEYYDQFTEWFENDNDYLLIGIRNEAGVFQSDFLARADSFSSFLATLPEVVSVNSPTQARQLVIGPLGPVQVPYLHWDDPARLPADSQRVFQTEVLLGNSFSEDGKAIAIFLNHTQFLSNEKGEVLVDQIEASLPGFGFDEVHIAGKAKAQAEYIYLMQGELVGFLLASFCLVVVFLAITYRSWFGVSIPMLVVGLGVLGIMGIMGALGKDLDLMMVMLPTIMFVVGMSDVVHILTKYIEELRLGMAKEEALRTTLKEVGLATFLTSLTTALGFFTLYLSNIIPIRDFGLYTAIGVFTAFVMAFTVLPSFLILMKQPVVVTRTQNMRVWNRVLRGLFRGVLKYRFQIITAYGVLFLLSLCGVSKVEIDSLLLEDISKNNPLKADFDFFDKTFGGTRPFEMSVAVTDSTGSLFELENLQDLDQLHVYLQTEYGADNLMSPLVWVKSIMQALNGGNVADYRIPANENELSQVNRYLTRLLRREGASSLLAMEGQMGRITGKMPDIGSKLSLEAKERMDVWMEGALTGNLQARLTGTSLLIDKNNEYLANNMFEGLAIAFAIISLIAGAMFKSMRMILITLVSNIIPLLMVAAIMGFTGISLKLSTSIIFTIAFGIAVDDTIHFMSKLRIEVGREKSLLYALKRTFLHTGKAIIITSAILGVGFLILLFSSFGGTFYIGLLVGLTLLFALVIELTLLPVLILWFFKRRERIIPKRKQLA